MTKEPDPIARLERHLGWLLLSGVLTSAGLLALGLLLLIVAPDEPAAWHLLSGGLMILMATPMLRVIVSMVEYVRMGEWLFVMTTVVVFVELAAGVVYALRR